MGAITVGWGTALGEREVTNLELERTLDTNDAWITERTGIRSRHIGGSTASLATAAACTALERAQVDPASIDVFVLATCTPDATLPPTSALVSSALGVRCGAIDVNAACAGFVQGLLLAHGMLGQGAQRALVVGADTMSRLIDHTDRTTAVLFGDAAGAVVLEHTDGPGELLAWETGTEPGTEHLITCDAGGTMVMEGQEVFRRGVRMVVESCERLLARSGVDVEDVALFVPHQANLRILLAAADRLGIDERRIALAIVDTGNTSAASVPLALARALDDNRVQPGDLLLSVGFGAGLTWATALTRWGG